MFVDFFNFVILVSICRFVYVVFDKVGKRWHNTFFLEMQRSVIKFTSYQIYSLVQTFNSLEIKTYPQIEMSIA